MTDKPLPEFQTVEVVPNTTMPTNTPSGNPLYKVPHPVVSSTALPNTPQNTALPVNHETPAIPATVDTSTAPTIKTVTNTTETKKTPTKPPAVIALLDTPTIAICNQSTVVTDAELEQWVAALQIQIDRDFSPVWFTAANLIIEKDAAKAPANDYAVFIMDHSDVSGALGYHETSAGGVPIAKIFAKDDQTYNLSTSVTLSHELLEMLADPSASCCVFNQTSNTAGEVVAFEVCDAVEDDSYGYKINDVLVSDFVFPSWFDAFRTTGSTQFDFCKKLNGPFTLGVGGYYSYFAVPNTAGWQQMTPPSGPGARLKSKPADYRSRGFHYKLISPVKSDQVK